MVDDKLFGFQVILLSYATIFEEKLHTQHAVASNSSELESSGIEKRNNSCCCCSFDEGLFRKNVFYIVFWAMKEKSYMHHKSKAADTSCSVPSPSVILPSTRSLM